MEELDAIYKKAEAVIGELERTLAALDQPIEGKFRLTDEEAERRRAAAIGGATAALDELEKELTTRLDATRAELSSVVRKYRLSGPDGLSYAQRVDRLVSQADRPVHQTLRRELQRAIDGRDAAVIAWLAAEADSFLLRAGASDEQVNGFVAECLQALEPLLSGNEARAVRLGRALLAPYARTQAELRLQAIRGRLRRVSGDMAGVVTAVDLWRS